MTAGPSPKSDAPAEADPGLTTEHDISLDPGETIFDVSLDDVADPLHLRPGKPGQRAIAEEASETHLLFEEDDLQRLIADVESAATANSPAGPQSAEAASETAVDAKADEQPAGRGLLGFWRRKKKPENSDTANSDTGNSNPATPDDNDDQLRRFLSDS